MNWRWKIAQAAEIRWWQNYLGKKSETDYLAWKQSYWQQFLVQIGVQANPNTSVLDAGCGPAGIFIHLPKCDVDALDPLLPQYEEKLPHFSQKKYPYTRFFGQALEEFVPDKTYDYVFCLNAINHVADLEKCLDLIVQSTAKNGTLIMSIDAHNHGFFKHLFRLLPGDILHPHQYDLPEYEAMLTSRNMTIERSILVKKEFFFDYHVLVAKFASG